MVGAAARRMRNGRAVEERLRWIDGALQWEGGFNRRDAAARFGVSESQVSADLDAYNEIGPGHGFYDYSQRTIRPPERHVPSLAVGLPEWLRLRDAGGEPSGIVEPDPELDPKAVSVILRSLRRRQPCEVSFFSAARAGSQRMTFHPHSLFADGPNWHARGWDGARRAFVDLSLSHAVEARVAEGGAWIPADADEAWQASVRLALVASPSLSPGRRFLVEREFGMRDGRVVLTVRRALVGRVLARYGILRALRAGLAHAEGATVWPEEPEAALAWSEGFHPD